MCIVQKNYYCAPGATLHMHHHTEHWDGCIRSKLCLVQHTTTACNLHCLVFSVHWPGFKDTMGTGVEGESIPVEVWAVAQSSGALSKGVSNVSKGDKSLLQAHTE